MDYIQIHSLDQIKKALEKEPVALVYFSHHNCNVCKVLKPKVTELVKNNFPQIVLYYINTMENPEIAGQFSVFTVPTILVFFDNKEYIRESRHIGLEPFKNRIEKLYKVYFES